MKLALISDIHSNRQAFEACLAHARMQGAEQFALLGDFVGYGADPVAVVDEVMRLAGQGAWVIRGNHDEMAVRGTADDGSLGTQTSAWTHAQLPASHRQFLAGLPLTISLPPLLLVHASASKPEAWRYVDSERAATACIEAAPPQTPHVLVGHVHQQTLYYRASGRNLMSFKPAPGVPVPLPPGRALVACIGSCGQPRDGDPRAMYAIHDAVTSRITFYRVPYNHVDAAAAIRAAGLPDLFADRLEVGR